MEKNTVSRKHVETLIEKAAKCQDSGDAMRFSQAACNAANAVCAINSADVNYTEAK